MSGICLGVALALAQPAVQAAIPADTLTLSWMHSVEKVRWTEQYRIAEGLLVLADAAVAGSGAGMEPPEGALFRDGAWHYVPALPPQRAITLTRSSYTTDYRLCWDGACRSLTEVAGPMREEGETIQLFACPGDGKEAR